MWHLLNTHVPRLDRPAVWSRFSRVMVGKAQDKRMHKSRGENREKQAE